MFAHGREGWPGAAARRIASLAPGPKAVPRPCHARREHHCKSMLPTFDEILANFEFIDDWEERYRYIIELGKLMPRLPEDAYNDVNKVRGCASQVWLETTVERRDGEPVLVLRGDSDAHIVRGLVALIIALYSGKPASEALAVDASEIFDELGLSEHLTPQRSNGVRAIVERIRRDARSALDHA